MNQPSTIMLSEDPESLPPVRTLRLFGVDYVLGHQIGVGYFSRVYGGQDMWGNAVAVKVLLPGADLALGEREAKALRRFRHPCVPHCHGAGQHDGRFYLVMERCGIAVSRMRPEPAVRPYACLVVARALLQALHSVHVQGWVHADVCPNNVLIQDGSRQAPAAVKLADFALCMPQDEFAGFREVVAPWQPLPERLQRELHGPLGTAADIYCACLVLLEVLTGERRQYTADETLAGVPRRDAARLGTPVGMALASGLALDASARPSAAALWSMLPRPVSP